MTTLDTNTERIIVATFDGSCLGNPGPGGYAAVLHEPATGKRRTISGGVKEPKTTNGRAELTAAIMALTKVAAGASVTMRGDAEYVVRGMSEWFPAWKASGWRKANKKPVTNHDLWQALDAATQRHASVTWEHVAGHAGDADNEEAHRAAFAAAQKVKARAEKAKAT